MKSVVQSKLKSLANRVRNTLSKFQPPTATVPLTTAIRVGPNRVILRIALNNNLIDHQIESTILSTKPNYFDQTIATVETVIVSLVPRIVSNSASLTNQDFKHQVTLKVSSAIKNLTVNFQDQHKEMKLIEKILIK
jgi:hypothetical protein